MTRYPELRSVHTTSVSKTTSSVHNVSLTASTRWYPRGIQQLVSTYELPKTRGGVQTNTTQSAKICSNLLFWEGRGWVVVVVQTRPFSGAGGGGGWWFKEWGHSWNFEPKILATGMCSASQIVSHILRVCGD